MNVLLREYTLTACFSLYLLDFLALEESLTLETAQLRGLIIVFCSWKTRSNGYFYSKEKAIL